MPPRPSAKSLILYTDSTYFSGAEKSFGILARSLTGQGNDVQLVVTDTAAERFAEYAEAGKLEAGAKRSKLNYGYYRSWVSRLRHEKPAAVVVNMWSPYANTLFLLAAKRARVPVITIYHYYQERSAVTGPLAPLKLMAYRLGERLATRILTVSQAHRAVLVQQFGFPEGKVGVLPNGTSAPEQDSTYQDHSPRRLLAVGSLEPAKGYDFLLEVLKNVPEAWELTIVGDGPERGALQAIAEKSQLPVTFAGLQKDMSVYYIGHDVLVHPSHFENLSMAIIESMSYGLACVANDVGGNSELVGSESGWLLPLGDVSAWQHALTEACSVSLASKRRTARDRWEKHFTVERQAEVMRTELAALSHVG